MNLHINGGAGIDNMVTDYDLQALVDHQLHPDEAQRIYNLVLASSLLRWRYDELITQKKLLQQWWTQKLKN